jgi:hypothetical protein
LILGQNDGISLDRPDEAIAVLQKAFDLAEEWAESDPHDAGGRIMMAQSADELARVLCQRDPQRALAVLDRGIFRLGEIRNNTTARNDEARLLAGSTFALRRLHRTREAGDRIDTAFRLLRDTKLYPAGRFDPDSPAEVALRALGDYRADTGQPLQAAETYQELLDRFTATKLDPLHDLRYAIQLSRVYRNLAGLERRNGRAGRAQSLSALRLELWRHWDAQLPHNAFVRRQLDAASLP